MVMFGDWFSSGGRCFGRGFGRRCGRGGGYRLGKFLLVCGVGYRFF